MVQMIEVNRAYEANQKVPDNQRVTEHLLSRPALGLTVSYEMGTRSFSLVKRPGRGADYPTPANAEVKERVDLNLYCPSGRAWPVLG